MTARTRVALVTGANRGLGFEVVRQLAQKGYPVILTARDPQKGAAAVNELRADGLSVDFAELDACSPNSIRRAVAQLLDVYGRIDIIVNNAGVNLDSAPLSRTQIDLLRKTLDTNLYAAIQLVQAVIPSMTQQGYGRIVNVSSAWGSLAEVANLKSRSGGIEAAAYRISKTALNMATILFARELVGSNILINSVCPGWVRTDMGSTRAPLSPAEGAETIVWLATLPDTGPTGGFFRERRSIPW